MESKASTSVGPSAGRKRGRYFFGTFVETLFGTLFGTLVETLFGTLVVHTFFVTLYRKENRFYHSSQNCQNWIVKLP